MMLWSIGGLLTLVVGILAVSRAPRCARVFRWLPIPLWCYVLPLLAVNIGWLPANHPAYPALIAHVLPIALALLLLGVDLPSLRTVGVAALLAAMVGAVGVVAGSVALAWLFNGMLPPDAWKGAGMLAGTWTGGTLNLLALRELLGTPESMFAPLILVDAIVAYGWMALLIAASAFQQPLDRWLCASSPPRVTAPGAPATSLPVTSGTHRWSGLLAAAALTCGLALSARWLGGRLPLTPVINSANGWAILIVTTLTLGLSFIPRLRQWGQQATGLGYPLLYFVLAATGAQGNLEALRSGLPWIGLGIGTVLVHGALLLAVGRLAHLPLGLLATASQANIGGVVSAPMVGAVYRQHLAPIGLLLAVAGNAVGTYVGLLAAGLSRMVSGGGSP